MLARISSGPSFRLLAGLLLINANVSIAADYPNRPIRLIVPYAAGGATDVTSRTIAPRLSEKLGQQIIVDNRPGGAAILGMSMVAKAPADGYTMLMATIAFAANPALYSKLPFDPLKDFTPVSLVATVPTVLAIHPSVPARSARELIALAKTKPGSLNFASAGNGTINHLAGELLKYMTGTNMIHVPYKGGSFVVTAVLSGEVSMAFTTTPTSLEFFKQGKLIPLAVSGTNRLAVLPDVPTLGETVQGFDAVEWQGIVVPAGTPNEVISLLHKEITSTLTDPTVRERILAQGSVIVGSTPQEFEAHIKTDLAKWAKVAKETGIKAD
jgi:tripartite-type tricarboxylate transporter receptor subunit TctC